MFFTKTVVHSRFNKILEPEIEQWEGKDANQKMTNRLQIQEAWCQNIEEGINVLAFLPFLVNQAIPLGASTAI